MKEKKRPSCMELEAHLKSGKSLTEISGITGYSVTYLSKMARDICGLEIPTVGRKKGFKHTNDTKKKISEANKK